ncbi:hypothetical protein LC040_12770 [Bacillus tianshenii]|nr:hypothetical protein LC040_12770 [Bacillus tianshenii]
MRKLLLPFLMTMILIFTGVSQVYAYSYGDPGEEQLAEAYKELKTHLENDDWESARKVYDTYKKEFDLYFTKTVPLIEEGFEKKDKELILESYQAAMRLNIERRLHFAVEQFDDYGQAKLLLAKARGTFNVLAPYVKEEKDEAYVNDIYASFDTSLESLGNPGLFGIGNQESDKETFEKEIESIIDRVAPIFPVPETKEDGESHLTEENLNLFGDENGESSPFWLWFSLGLFGILVILIIMNKRKKRQQ